MSVKVNIITGRKKDLEIMLKAIAEFWGKSKNKRVSVNLNIEAVEKDC